MQLTVRDVARLFQVNESTVYRWVSAESLPAEHVKDEYRFNRAEVLEWATVRHMPISPRLLKEVQGPAPEVPALADALRAGGIFYALAGADKAAVLHGLVHKLPLPDDFDRDFLLEVFLSREASGSTNIGDGIALPHPRFPVVVPGQPPYIALAFLAKPIAYSADGQQVHTLFALLSPTVRVHLGLLARLAFALRDRGFADAIRRRAPAAEILEHAEHLEQSLEHLAPPPEAR